MKKIKADVFILGAGAGGMGLAYFLASNGIKAAVCDVNPYFGGTAVYSGVSCWEPGVSFDGLHQILKDYLLKSNGGSQRRFQFYDSCMTKAFANAVEPFKENLIPLFGKRFSDVKTNGGNISSVIVSGVEPPENSTEIEARVFADCTGDIVLARAAGCGCTIGSEGKDDYNEPSANGKFDKNALNGVTYVFKVGKTDDPAYVDKLPPGTMEAEFDKNTVSCFNLYPNGEIYINMLPTMDGAKYSEAKHEECLAIVRRYWNFLQKEKGLAGYKIAKIYDPGIRESYRLKGRYVLTENDLVCGIFRQKNPERFVAIADHMRDVHGDCGLSKELETPFGIPLESLETKEFDNLFVCSRGASFSHIAASSARLTRTLISAGEGLGSFICSKYFEKNNSGFISERLKTIKQLEAYLQ